jgi:thioredoxin reductase (NADPH)
MKTYEVIIIGSGPAGITAGIYAKNFDLDCLIIGKREGGLVNSAYKVENYPGIFNISGKELTKKFIAHQKHLKVPFKKERVEAIEKTGNFFKLLTNKNKYQAKTLVLTFGTEPQKIKIKNLGKFENKGVYYQLGDNAFLFKNKIVAVIGGANSAVMTAIMLTEIAKKVYLIYRKDRLRADAIWINRIKKCKNIEIIYRTNIVDLKGKNKLKEIILDNGKKLKIDGLFIGAGVVPNTFLIRNLGIKIDKNGYVKVDKTQATNTKGIFAAGDITTGSNEFRQIITACAEGAIAVLGVFNYLNKK